MSQFIVHPQEISSARDRAEAFSTQLLERLSYNNRINGSHGNPGGEQYAPISAAVARTVFDGRTMSLYRNTAGDKQHMKPVAQYFENMGIAPDGGKLTVDHIAPGYGVTNLYSLILPKIAKDYAKRYPGKEPVLLMTAPCYGLYTVQAEDAGLRVAHVPLQEAKGWRLQADDLEKTIAAVEADGTKKVAAFYNMNPHNPTGAVLGQREMKALAQSFIKHDVFVVDDMIYRGTEFNGKPAQPFAALPGMFDRTLTLIGLSKAFCTPSIRAAAACGRLEDVAYLRERNTVLLGSISLPTQVALAAALSDEPGNKREREDYFRRNRENYVRRYRLLQALTEGAQAAGLSEAEKAQTVQLVQKYFSVVRPQAEKLLADGIPGVRLLNRPDSGYFALIDFSGHQGRYCGTAKVENATVVAAALADFGKTMILPAGYMQGGPELAMAGRITFALGDEQLVRMMRGVRQAVAQFSDEPNPAVTFALNGPARNAAKTEIAVQPRHKPA